MKTSRDTTTGTQATTTDAVLPAALRLSPAELVVTDLERLTDFYCTSLGLQVLRQEGTSAWLGSDDDPVLVLHENADAERAGRHAGLFHVALLYPSRLELARAGGRLAQTRTTIEGASDHGTHEAFYLSDPDGNGLELAADRPREQWTSFSQYDGRPQPLDVDDLMSLVAGETVPTQAGPGLVVGHLHLHVGNIAQADEFYVGVLGFEKQAALPTASFVSAGGYHHHLAYNVWKGEGVPPMPANAVGLRHWTVELPTGDDFDTVLRRLEAAGIPVETSSDGGIIVRDPWNTALRLAARAD